MFCPISMQFSFSQQGTKKRKKTRDKTKFLKTTKKTTSVCVLCVIVSDCNRVLLEDPLSDNDANDKNEKGSVYVGCAQRCCIWRHGLNSEAFAGLAWPTWFITFLIGGQSFLSQCFLLKRFMNYLCNQGNCKQTFVIVMIRRSLILWSHDLITFDNKQLI